MLLEDVQLTAALFHVAGTYLTAEDESVAVISKSGPNSHQWRPRRRSAVIYHPQSNTFQSCSSLETET